jgi:hypothetical protein
MRDVGILIWVGLLIVGVIGSMVSSLRRQGQARTTPRPQTPQQAPAPPIWAQRIAATMAPPQQPSRPPRPLPRSAPAPTPPERVVQHEARPASGVERRQRRLFAGKNEIVRAVIASEVLGKPRALNDEYFGC